MPKTSIIIVSYNNFATTTGPCIESILQRTGDEDYEIVIVDNASGDGTADQLRAAAAIDPRVKPIYNETNRGFAGGNNDGVKASSGKYLVLLNSDTQVTKGWLRRIIEMLERDNQVGLVGPISNSTGNEQQIFVSGTTPEEIIKEGAHWVKNSVGDFFPTERLTFFCVAMRRSIYEALGGLDEGFGLGFYEDDDFCIRACKAGYLLVCCEDVFIYHRGNESFGKVPKKVRTLMKHNRRLLEEKIGGRYRCRHPRERQLDLVESYLQSPARHDGIKHKCFNRLAMAKGMVPRGFFKKIRYLFRLTRLTQRCQELGKGMI